MGLVATYRLRLQKFPRKFDAILTLSSMCHVTEMSYVRVYVSIS